MTEGTWNVLLMAVCPTVQGEGYGGLLLRSIEAELRSRNARVALVETSGLDTFARTRKFYRECGYEEEARIRDFYAAGEDKIVFRKALDAPMAARPGSHGA
jgi:ribosomal protein S18 acetylase RimI-like enzyme